VKIENSLEGNITFIPNAAGDVLCLHCQRQDNIHRRGINELIGCEPQMGVRLYIHERELHGMDSTVFIEKYYRAHAAAMRGEEAH